MQITNEEIEEALQKGNIQFGNISCCRQWISVEDRLPPNTHVDNYLVYDETYGVVVSFYSPSHGDWDRLFFGLGESKYKHVTHYQPLPEPPEVNDG